MSFNNLFNKQLKIINLGLEVFYNDLKNSGVEALQVDWKPPLVNNLEAFALINKNKTLIEKANNKAIEILLNGTPVLLGLDLAINVIPGMKKNLILHSGPPVQWENMCGPTKGAIIGALMYENLASTPKEAEKLAASGKIKFAPCHEHNSVGPMAGIISPSMPVFIVKNEKYGNYAYCTLNEGLGKVLRYGAYDKDVIDKLHWMKNTLYPILKKAIELTGKIDIKNIIAQALHMGDEVHNRNRAATSLLYRILAPAILRTANNIEDAANVLDFINNNDHFFLNLSMPASKAVLDAARNIKGSSMVIVMARNGTEWGIQLSGTGNTWFTGISPIPDALYFSGYTKKDANPDIGDSAITETAGLGGFAIASAPAIVQFVGGNVSDAINYTLEMYEITIAENNIYQIPNLNFRGTPTGIDVIKVIEKNITPFIDTGVAHKKPGIGQVGAGVLKAPVEPFIKAFNGFIKTLK
ncbi:MAG TPA: DUF1116 domain-containing protein [Bacteroidales bacterium]|nr:DUF1116 domain-containing protein [Bacteroidales bacterium]